MTSISMENATTEDTVDAPALYWWVAIIGGLVLLGIQGFNTEFYNWWIANMHPLPGQNVMAWILIACLPIHLFEAIYVYRVAQHLGMPNSAMGWAVQTFILGYPSTHLIRKRARAMGVTK